MIILGIDPGYATTGFGVVAVSYTHLDVYKRQAVLAEGAAQQRDDIIYLEGLPVFNPDGTVKA